MAFSIFKKGLTLVSNNSTRRIFDKNVMERSITTFRINQNELHILETPNCKCCTSRIHANRNIFPAFTIREYAKVPQPEKNLSSQSESDSDLDVLGHRGESQFWRRKVRTFHGILDVNKDGVISFDDFQLLADRFVQLGHLSEKHTKEFRQCIRDLWEKRWGEINPYNLVTVEQFLEDLHHVLNDKVLVRRAHSFLPYLFKAVDKDRSGEISVEEYKLFFQCLGLSPKDAVTAFRAIDTDKNNKISLKEFVKEGRDFFLTEDETRPSKYFFGPLCQ